MRRRIAEKVALQVFQVQPCPQGRLPIVRKSICHYHQFDGDISTCELHDQNPNSLRIALEKHPETR